MVAITVEVTSCSGASVAGAAVAGASVVGALVTGAPELGTTVAGAKVVGAAVAGVELLVKPVGTVTGATVDGTTEVEHLLPSQEVTVT